MKERIQSYRPKRAGERKRKSVRGCITGPDLCVLSLKVLEKGAGEIAGLTDDQKPRRLGPKRVGKIKKGDKTFYKAPCVQRLITDKRIRRKADHKKGKIAKWKATKEAHMAYEKLLSYLKEK